MPTPGTHRVLLKQSDGTYTAVESENEPPHGILRTDPHFEKQLSACLPTPFAINSDSFGVRALAKLPSGGYIIATYGPNPETDITVFDAGSQLIAESTYTDALPLAFADLNGDGIPDLIGTKYTFGHFQVLTVALGTGGAAFAPPTTYQFSGGDQEVDQVAVADLNGDHKPDLVVLNGNPDSGKVSVLYGNGDGTFQQEKVLVTSATSPRALAVADLNGDGRPDLVFTNTDLSTFGPNIEVALASGDGAFISPEQYLVTAADYVAIGDVNGDGIPDIVTNGITILYGDGKGGFRSRRYVPVKTSGNPIVTDFDGDGIADIVMGLGNSEIIAGYIVVVLSGLGNGQFAGPPVSFVSNYPAADAQLDALAAADVNGDGIPDLATVDNLGQVSILTGRGDGTFQSTFQFNVKSGVPSALAFTDFNHDGRLDLAVVASGYTSSSSGEVDISLGNGEGTFQPAVAIPAPLGAFDLGVGDFNGDGKPDLAILISQENSGASDAVLIVAGNGDGTFTTGATYPVGPRAHSLAVGDFNGDGKLDIVVADAGTLANQNKDGNIALLLGNGDGTFADALITPFTDGYYGPYSMIAADFNRDGRLDLVLTVLSGGVLTLLGRGDGTFQPPAFHAINALTVQASDLNGDGLLDLITSGSNGTHYTLGEGDGSFGPESPALDAGGPLAVADFNRHGKADIAGASVAGIVTLLNTSVPVPAVSVVSAASLAPGPIAQDSIATAFSTTFPETGAAVSIVDSTGASFAASVIYASATQINFTVPAGLDAGPATVTIQSTNAGLASQSAGILIAPAAPSLFSVKQGGLAAAYVTRVASSGAQTNEPILKVHNGNYTPIPIDVTNGQAYLILFGTGIRNASGLTLLWKGAEIDTLYAGKQPTFPGLDQVNVLLPVAMAGSGCTIVSLTAGYLSSNPVYVCIK